MKQPALGLAPAGRPAGEQRLDEVSRRVRAFYEDCSFPGYEEFDTPGELMDKARRGTYARLLDEQLPLGVRILDVGCGTGQLALFLSATHRRVIGADLSHASLSKGHRFKERFGFRDTHFVQMDLFHPALKAESFDFLFSNGVLHHTADARAGFRVLCRLVKPGGFIVVGLYNRYGRLLLDLRRLVFRLTRERFLWLDFFLRQKSLGDEKKRVWYMDQYRHPHEVTATVDEVLAWFGENGVEYVNAVPKIRLAERFTPEERLFEPRDPGTRLDHLLCQLGWIFTKAREGGFFILFGRKR